MCQDAHQRMLCAVCRGRVSSSSASTQVMFEMEMEAIHSKQRVADYQFVPRRRTSSTGSATNTSRFHAPPPDKALLISAPWRSSGMILWHDCLAYEV